MSIFLKKLTKPLLTNFLILFSFIVLIELIFGYWFDKDNFGPIMREHRLKNQPILYNYEGKTYQYNYKRNYYGFRGDDIDPSDIEAIIMGGSMVDERYKPDEFTITGYLNKNLKKNNYNLTIINAGIEAQSTVGMIYNFKHWFLKLKNFSPKIILYYIGMNDLTLPEDLTIKIPGSDGHVKNPEKIEVFFDNIKSRSFLYDKARIFKFKYLPRKNFVKYDGNIDPNLENDFEYINFETALKNYNIADLEKKYKKRITNYLSRADILYENAKKINSHPIFITNIGVEGHTENLFIYNYSLISHCKTKKYDCIDLARKLEGKFNYWSGLVHTTRRGSEIIANLITEDLLKFIKKN
tara:strand:+ start:62 stop:1120 length:1059 start_codon:yes stop_codon:yes gene_type:complete